MTSSTPDAITPPAPHGRTTSPPDQVTSPPMNAPLSKRMSRRAWPAPPLTLTMRAWTQ
jgi:hypothetical protein